MRTYFEAFGTPVALGQELQFIFSPMRAYFEAFGTPVDLGQQLSNRYLLGIGRVNI